jgi:hypothetical protein
MVINDYYFGRQRWPSIAVDADGDFVITWEDDSGDGSGFGTFARRFRAGVAIGGDFAVNTTTAAHQRLASVGADADGDFVVAWSSSQDGSSFATIGQRFDVPALLDIDGNGQLTALTDGLLVVRFLFWLHRYRPHRRRGRARLHALRERGHPALPAGPHLMDTA